VGYYAILYLIPALVTIGIAKVYLHYSVTWKEFAVQAVGTAVVLFVLFGLAGMSVTSDTQLINGVVTATDAKRQSCPQGWQDFTDSFCTEYQTRQVYSHTTCSGSGKDRVCTRHYDTEYRYIFPWEQRYFVNSSIPEIFEISRVDRQGGQIPPRFAEVTVGDPVTVSRSYTNYIKGASDSLFNEGDSTDTIPIAYPRVQDYYRANRVIITGYESSNDFYTEWNQSLAKVNADVYRTGANVIVVVTGAGEDFATELARSWQSHNINDVIVAIGMTGERVSWVNVRSWSETSLVNLEIKNEILNLGKLDPEQINRIIRDSVLENFTLQPMEKFEYLAEEISPPLWAMIIAALLLFVATPAITYALHKNDVF
jgi:hypothetical protein